MNLFKEQRILIDAAMREAYDADSLERVLYLYAVVSLKKCTIAV